MDFSISSKGIETSSHSSFSKSSYPNADVNNRLRIIYFIDWDYIIIGDYSGEDTVKA